MSTQNENTVSPEKTGSSDARIIARILSGDKQALEQLIRKYQDWIYNLAIRMVIKPEDAEDVTQEILVKVITNLNKFDPSRASFKTWLYRISANHMINMKKRGFENSKYGFENYYERMDFIEDKVPEDSKEIRDLVEDTLINCVLATLVCLSREARMIIILGVIFRVDSAIGAEVLGISRENFRKILSRSRTKLKRFMSTTCTLVNKKAKCKCHMKMTSLIEHGYKNPGKLMYKKLHHDKKIREVLGGSVSRFLTKYFYPFDAIFHSHPFWKAPDMVAWLQNAMQGNEFEHIFDPQNVMNHFRTNSNN
ncbi:MAG: RNA polymerase sigma factor [Spirochaetaceae bacterium]|nr:MAG: RNA polymerase sigma factor [Spirochaetaceae bacterium]